MRVWGWCVRAGVVALIVLGLDQLTKTAVNSSIRHGQHSPLLPGVQLVNVHNYGYMLGFGFVGMEVRMLMFAAVSGVLVLSLLIYLRPGARLRRAHSLPIPRLIWLPIGLMLGGALGNLGEVVSQGSATDFINIIGSHLAFNVADMAGLLGGLVLLAIMAPIRFEIVRSRPEPPSPDIVS
ncbi:MAG: signal peptidase II [Solirubrobacteraceae bacterium]